MNGPRLGLGSRGVLLQFAKVAASGAGFALPGSIIANICKPAEDFLSLGLYCLSCFLCP